MMMNINVRYECGLMTLFQIAGDERFNQVLDGFIVFVFHGGRVLQVEAVDCTAAYPALTYRMLSSL